MSGITAAGLSARDRSGLHLAPELRLPVGIVLRQRPGRTRWQREVWEPVALVPDPPAQDWVLLREEPAGEGGGVLRLWQAPPLELELHRAETSGYRVALSSSPPSAWVVLRGAPGERPELVLVTVSAFEAQDYADSSEDRVEPVPLPEPLIGLVSAFIGEHHREQPFRKRKRDRVAVDLHEDGRGDPRIRQPDDVYRAPRRRPAGAAGSTGTEETE